MSTILRRIVVMTGLALLLPIVGYVAGCTPTEPKMAEAPVFKAEPEKEAQKIPGRTQTYGASSKYQEAMRRQEAANAGK